MAMDMRIPPVTMLITAVSVGVVAVVALLYFAIQQPWLGAKFAADAADGVALVSVRGDGPARDIVPQSRLVSLEGVDGTSVRVKASDLVEEPDILATYTEMRDFFARQTALHGVIGQGVVTLRIRDPNGVEHLTTISAAPQRPVRDLPAAFWVQLSVGFAAWLVGVWVWCLRRSDTATALFALASFGIMGFTFPAALYSTRELAIDGQLFRALSVMNHGGALLFGAAMIALLLRYPKPLTPASWLYAPFAVFGVWWLADSFQLFEGPPIGSHLPTMLEMGGIVVCAALQYWRSRGDPGAKAVIRWFGLSITAGAGTFVLTVIAPSLIGLPPLLPQGYAFIFFLLIHCGLALGVARYRLFDLDRWAFRILFYMTAAALLLAIDVLLISWIAIGRAPAFGLALALVALFYLPLRDAMARWLSGRKELDGETWFSDMINVALAPSDKDRDRRWRELLNEVFEPLRMEPGPDVAAPTLLSEGAVLAIPAIAPLAAQRLEYARHGRRLFSPRDQARAVELCAMLAHAMDSRIAYEQGAAEERGRITRDMHDNIGVQLLGALHSRDTARKDALIRDTLVDLREIINNSSGQGLNVDEVMADLRAETADLLSDAGLELVWDMETIPGFPPQAVPALRSILRETISNILRHASASTVRVALVRQAEGVILTVEDDGCGFDPDAVVRGHGLENMRTRMAAMKGWIRIESVKPGTRITAHIPMEA